MEPEAWGFGRRRPRSAQQWPHPHFGYRNATKRKIRVYTGEEQALCHANQVGLSRAADARSDIHEAASRAEGIPRHRSATRLVAIRARAVSSRRPQLTPLPIKYAVGTTYKKGPTLIDRDVVNQHAIISTCEL